MFRARRYRVLLVFAAAFVFAFIHFARSRAWSDAVVDEPSTFYPSDHVVPESRPDTKYDEKPVIPAEDTAKRPPVNPDEGSSSSSPSEKLPIIAPVDSSKGDVEKGSISGSYINTAEKASNKEATHSYSAGSADKVPSSKLDSSELSDHLPYQSIEEIDHGGTGRVSVDHPESGARRHWQKFPEQFPVPASELIKLPAGVARAAPKLQAKFKDESSAEKQERLQQLSTIRAEFTHAWEGYKKAALGHDEVKPLSAGYADPFNGWGATLVDTLDTLWIMDMKDEFSQAVDEVKKIDFTTSAREDIPVFETVIRYLGGLLGAYDISGQRYSVLLDKAKELAEILIGAFDTPNRMPVLYYRWTPDHVSRPHRASSAASLAEIGSLSLEFTRLAQLTKDDKYYDAIARITNGLEQLQDSSNIPGLWPLHLNAQGCAKYRPSRDVGTPTRQGSLGEEPATTANATATTTTATHRVYAAPTDLESYLRLIQRDSSDDYSQAEPAVYSHSKSETSAGQTSSGVQGDVETADKCDGSLELPTSLRDNKYGLGGLADSTYEYLPKEHLLLGGATDQYKKMYKKAMDAVRKTLLFRPMVKGERDLRFTASTASLDPLSKAPPSSADMIYEGTHLHCFVGGMVAVGAKAFGIEGDLDIAAKLTDGCVWAYEATNTGIMPERFKVLPCEKDTSCEWDGARYETDMRGYSHLLDSAAKAQYRTSESAYGQRVKMNTDFKPQEPGEDGQAVPLPMPGSMNPHDSDPVLKRRSFAVGRESAVPMPTPGSRTAGTEGIEIIESRDSPRLPQPPFLSNAEGNERHERIPAGMTNIPSPEYLLRPEAIESVFIMYRLTGDNYWRVKGWKMFEAIVKHSRSELAHAAIKDVTSQKPTQKDSMESFWLAETLKYFYLLFSDPSVVDLDKYVLNTEAHPFLRPIS